MGYLLFTFAVTTTVLGLLFVYLFFKLITYQRFSYAVIVYIFYILKDVMTLPLPDRR